VSAIEAAEKKTSGEIRVFIFENEVKDPVAQAREEFERLGMRKTAQRNGVLLFFAPLSQAYAVFADEAVYNRCGEHFWHVIRDEMHNRLKADDYTGAIVGAVRQIGEALAQYFPPIAGDRNELPNQIERGG
ncbi:MAG: TPM domain-containing protein, partial [Verrucomicrobiota bacterium]|nr:TPM domain-containing protein [Verrucomicrobiota bacterium]